MYLINIVSQNVEANIDKTAPEITGFNVIGNSDAVAGYTKTTSVTYTITANDNKSTIVSGLYTYTIKDGTEQIGYAVEEVISSGTLANSTNGTHTLTLTITDKAGNSTSVTDTIILDTVAPTISTFSAKDNDASNNDITPLAGYTNSQAISYL